jgi:hypothetical protein
MAMLTRTYLTIGATEKSNKDLTKLMQVLNPEWNVPSLLPLPLSHACRPKLSVGKTV